MRTVRRCSVVAIVGLLAVVVLVGPASAGKRSRMSLLFTVSGAAATMTPVAGSTDGSTLTVTGADPFVVWFSDRPVRRSGVASLAWFADQWGRGNPFAADPPNGAIVLHTAVGSTDTVVVELRTLRADPAVRTVTADVRVLGEEEADELTGNLAFHGARHDASAIPAQLGAVSLFVDPEIAYHYGRTADGGNGGPGGAGLLGARHQ